MGRLLSATLLVLVLLPSAAAVAADRPRDLLVDACRDERVDGTYSQRTYRRALDQLPADSDQYTACRDVINRARLAALSTRSSNRSSGGGSADSSGSAGASVSGGGGGSGRGGGSRGGGGGDGGASGSHGSGTSTSSSANACQGCKGSGTALDTATPDELKGVKEAASSGSNPVRIGGRLLRPGVVGRLSSHNHTLPTSLTMLLAALGACALAATGAAAWNRVLARRTR